MHNLPLATFKYVFELSDSPFLILKPDAPFFTVAEVNQAYLNSTLLQREDLLNKSLFHIFPPPEGKELEGDGLYQTFLKVIASKEKVHVELYQYDLHGKDSLTRRRYWTSTNTPVLDEEGEVQFILHAPVDVTHLYELSEREKTAREESSFQQKYLKSIFQKSPAGVIIMRGSNHSIDYINESACEVFGCAEEELLGNPLFEVLPRFAGMGFEEILDDVKNRGVSYMGMEAAIPVIKDGEPGTAYINFTDEPYYEPDGTISGVISIGIDVTTEVELRMRLEESEQRLKLAIEAANLGVWDYNLISGKSISSPKVAEIFGYENADESWGTEAFLSHLVEEDKEIAKAALLKSISSGRININVRIKRGNNSIRWIQVTGSVYYDENNVPLRMLGTTLDITETKDLEQRKDELISIVSHELKTPVTSLKALAQVLERKFSRSADQLTAVMLKKMVIQIDRLTLLIHDLLDVSRLEGGQLQLRKSEFWLNELVAETVAEVQRTTFSHEIIVEENPPVQCYSDKERVSQVLINLLTNAIKYSPQQNKVQVRLHVEDGQVCCMVRDFGIGIPLEKQDMIFLRFYRVSHERNYSFSGIGLGLYISSEIVKRLGGRIWFTSKEGKGSAFYFSLPLSGT